MGQEENVQEGQEGGSKLTGAQWRYLRGLANPLKPVVLIGKSGLTDTVRATVEQTLATRELIKIKFVALKEEKKALVAELASATSSEVVGIIGHTAALYRPHAEKEKRKITLP
jgi:RNA-binding protein